MGRLAVEESYGVVHAVSHGCKHILGQIRGSNVLQAFDREVMKGDDFVPILGQFGADPRSFAAMGVNEELQGGMGLLLCFRHSDILQSEPRFLALGFGHRSGVTCCLVDPAILLMSLHAKVNSLDSRWSQIRRMAGAVA